MSDLDQVWVRLHGLIRAYITDKFVFNVAVPFKVDSVTCKRFRTCNCCLLLVTIFMYRESCNVNTFGNSVLNITMVSIVFRHVFLFLNKMKPFLLNKSIDMCTGLFNIK